jgi:hypothetical protein
MPGSMPAAASARREEHLLETVIACDKREAFAQGSASDEAIHSSFLRRDGLLRFARNEDADMVPRSRSERA